MIMKIKVLVENTSIKESLEAEHGLSLYIETEKAKILFDSGKSGFLTENAEVMGVNLTEVDFAVLSHGHYDHGGGLSAFSKINKTAPIYINKNAFEEYYNGTEKFIGLDKNIKNTNVILTDDDHTIDEQIELFTCNSQQPLYETESIGLNELKDGKFSQDRFLHEQYMLIKENGKRVLFSGCSHKGILNIIEWVKPDIFVGGFHLMNLDPQTESKEKLDLIARKLIETDCMYYTCHCTGVEQYDYLKTKMKDKLKYISSGLEFDI